MPDRWPPVVGVQVSSATTSSGRRYRASSDHCTRCSANWQDRVSAGAHVKACKSTSRSRSNSDVVADRGYYNSQEILACKQNNITVTLPKATDLRTTKLKASSSKQTFAMCPSTTMSMSALQTGLPFAGHKREDRWPELPAIRDQRLHELRDHKQCTTAKQPHRHPVGTRACS